MTLRDRLPLPDAVATCPHEDDVLDLVVMGQWPARADQDLREHADGCRVCRDVVVAAGAVAALHEADTNAAAPGLPDASVVWVRAQTRAREDAARRAAQPLHLAVGLSVASFAGLLLAWWSLGAPWMVTGWHRLTSAATAATQHLTDAQAAASSFLPAALPLLAAALALSVAVISLGLFVARLADK